MKDLLHESLGTVIETTNLTRKLTIDGVTKVYPVYRVKLDQLYYNDQNDRIASWISQYKSEHGEDAFIELDRNEYNSVIEKFIIQSNEAAIDKTQMNIALVRQREPGVILSDGRVIDGNRRFTCLRRLSVNDPEYDWFETVILDTNIEADKKQIKMLELAIQHGEEKKVDYNTIDRLVGIYQDIIDTELLTVEEYANSTNETVFEVKKRIEQALLLEEFLEYINMPKQWHIARDYQVVSVIADLQQLLRKCSTHEMRESVKRAVFTNVMMHTIGDSRRYVRNISSMIDSGFFPAYIRDQERIAQDLKQALEQERPQNKKEIEHFVKEHEEAAEELQISLDRSLLKAKKRETRNRPSQIVSKSISLLKDVDTNVFEKLTDLEKDNLRGQLNRLSTVVERFDTMIDDDVKSRELESDKGEHHITVYKEIENKKTIKPRFYIAKRHILEPIVICLSIGKRITNLGLSMEFTLCEPLEEQKREVMYRAFFIDQENEIISDIREFRLSTGDKTRELFTLMPKASSLTECMLALQSEEDSVDELQQLIPFEINILFSSDFDF